VIAVFTGNRAEYGLQFPILKAIDAHEQLDYRLIVSGAHLDADFGHTLAEINNDGFRIEDEVKIEMLDDNLSSTANAIGSGVISISKSLSRIKPDIFVVYADRFEGFAAVIAGTQMGIPTAHIEGGDITEGGALDDSVRHAMTKLSHLHFATNQEAAQRIEKMGEENWRVHNVGFPAIDLIAQGSFASPEELTNEFGLDINRSIILCTQHSVATQSEEAAHQIKPILANLTSFAENDVQVILTYPNNDAGGRRIISEIKKLDDLRIPGLQVFKSVGRYNYHGLLDLCGRVGRGVCIGNSSSGIKETPAFGCPTVNIGSRQDGRLASTNVINVDYDHSQINDAIKLSLFDDQFRKRCSNCDNPYGVGGAGVKIANVLAEIDLDHKLITKKMTLK
jgi:UDP-hydrolysing UDP-N-acetyl-D-glucosamine 2-epimerase